MASDRPSRREQGKGSAHQDSGISSESPDEAVNPVVYCAFPKPHLIVGGPYQIYDRDHLFYQHDGFSEHLDRIKPLMRGMPQEVQRQSNDFLSYLGLEEGMSPQDASRAWLVRMYVLARSSCMVVHLDMIHHVPEMTLANMAEIPVVGVTEKHNIHPCLRQSLDIVVNPVQRHIVSVIKGIVNNHGQESSNRTL